MKYTKTSKSSYELTTHTLWKREQRFVNLVLLLYALSLIVAYFLGGFDLLLFCLPGLVIGYIMFRTEGHRVKPSSSIALVTIDDSGIVFYSYGARKVQKHFFPWSDIDSIHSRYSIYYEERCIFTIVLKNGYVFPYDLYRNTILRTCPVRTIKKKMIAYSGGTVIVEKIQFNFRMELFRGVSLFNLNLKL